MEIFWRVREEVTQTCFGAELTRHNNVAQPVFGASSFSQRVVAGAQNVGNSSVSEAPGYLF